jgi:hypothetical protein
MNSFFSMKLVMHLWGIFLAWQVLTGFARGEVFWALFYAGLFCFHLWAMSRRREVPEDAE